jgi:hypothetical protein
MLLLLPVLAHFGNPMKRAFNHTTFNSLSLLYYRSNHSYLALVIDEKEEAVFDSSLFRAGFPQSVFQMLDNIGRQPGSMLAHTIQIVHTLEPVF